MGVRDSNNPRPELSDQGRTRNRFVGKAKTGLTNRFTKEHEDKSQQDELLAHLKEFEEWANPAFNVLIIQMPRLGFLDVPLLQSLRETVGETGVLLQNILRFGLPQTSVRNKLPHWREDNSPLPTTPSVRLKEAIHQIHVPRQQQPRRHHGDTAGRVHDAAYAVHGDQPSVLGGRAMHMHMGGASVHGTGGDHGGGGGHSKFMFPDDPVSPGLILGLNIALWWFLSTPKN